MRAQVRQHGSVSPVQRAPQQRTDDCVAPGHADGPDDVADLAGRDGVSVALGLGWAVEIGHRFAIAALRKYPG